MFFKFVLWFWIIKHILFCISADNGCEKINYSIYDIVCKCNDTYCDEVHVKRVSIGKFITYTSSKSGLRFHKNQGDFSSFITIEEDVSFKINREKKYQTIFGFGGAFTDSAGINILSLSKPVQENLLKSYFSSGGISYNMCRIPIGGSDFSTRPYTLDDSPGDINLSKFNLSEEDLIYKIPIIKRAQAITDEKIKLIATAWTAPPWMKTNNDYTGFGILKYEYYHLWAIYHRKFLENYKKEGLDIWGITTGNEPLNGFLPFFVKFNSMGWIPSSQTEWIAKHLGPVIRSSEFNSTKIILFDDQRFLLPSWIYKVMSSKSAAKYVDGFASHWYYDNLSPVKVITDIVQTYNDTFFISTEASEGFLPWEQSVILGSWNRAENYIWDIMEDLNNGMSGWIDWNLCLNMNGGPNWANNYVDSAIIVNAENDEFYKQPMFYALGHFSKFIKPDAVRIEISPQTSKHIVTLAVLNDDRSITLNLYNSDVRVKQVKIIDSERGVASIILQPNSITTVIYW